MRVRSLFLLGLVACLAHVAAAAVPPESQADAVEFYNAAADHYFLSANPAEIDDLDKGVHPGWTRTGFRIPVVKAGVAYPASSPVCRFFSEKLNSHFYSAKPAECDDVKAKFPDTWLFESGEVFRAFLVDPQTGACPADSAPVYRLYDNRPDANHRYTDRIDVFDLMKSKGWIPEGDGNPARPVAFCAPTTPPPAGPVPACTLTTETSTPRVGSSITLRAACTNVPATYAWQECLYYVPSLCNPIPECSTTPNCTVSSFVTALTRYHVAGVNASGAGPVAEVQVEWRGNDPGYTAGMCSQYPRAKLVSLPWGYGGRYTTIDDGGFPADMVLVFEMTVPSSPASYATAGYTSVAEYDGVPAQRHMTLSRTPCDFRDADPTGVNGPLAAAGGLTALIDWNVGAPPVALVAGQRYYFNIRNVVCGQLTCEAGFSTTWPR